MSIRKPIPKNTETIILTNSRRRCCVCFGLNKDHSEKQGQIAHLDKNPANNLLDNLAFLCLDHHDRYDSRTSQSKGFQIEELKKYREQLYFYNQNEFKSVSMSEISLTSVASTFQEIVEPINPADLTEVQIDLQKLEDFLGMSKTDLQNELEEINILFNIIRNSSLSRKSIKILSSFIEIADDNILNQRILESESGYDYLSREFYDEITVLEHKGLLEFSMDYEYSSNIQFPRGHFHLWTVIKEITKFNNRSIKKILEYPDLEYLLNPQ